jgi:hypothetical protein
MEVIEREGKETVRRPTFALALEQPNTKDYFTISCPAKQG